jgi:hypothetical protein
MEEQIEERARRPYLASGLAGLTEREARILSDLGWRTVGRKTCEKSVNGWASVTNASDRSNVRR